ncbi:MAG: hypothetical protein J1G04_06190 [Clostridiales bacterium]|nr:hypothetical protein [Clostridiales bacterium]
MREEKQFKKIVEEKLSPLYGDIKKELEGEFPEMFEDKKEKAKRADKRKKTAIGFLAAVAVCCAVILPCALLLPREDNSNIHYGGGGDLGNSGGAPQPTSYHVVDSDLTIKEYNEEYGTDILHFDFYDDASSCTTKLYVDNRTDEMFCIEERMVSVSVGTVTLMSEENGAEESVVGEYVYKCTLTQELDFGELKYIVTGGNVYGLFEYGNRRYGVTLENETNAQRLFELLKNLF